MIAVLGRIAALPQPPPRAAALCASATSWLRSQRREPNPFACFPTGVDRGRPVGAPPNAWCYGDPGVATAVWSAAVRTHAPVAEWHELAIEAAARSDADSRVEVAGLCHGAIGLAHLFNRSFQACGDVRLRDAARRWFANGLAMRRPGEGIAGFVVPVLRNGESQWTGSTSFIEGVTGIGLALLAALGDEEPGWDRLLACDLPPMDHAAGGSDTA